MDPETELQKVRELKTRLALHKALPDGCSPQCGVIAYGADFGKRVASAGNKHYKAGTIHEQCADCRLRDKNLTEICYLRHDLGFKA